MAKPSLLRVYLKNLSELFWEWQGIKSGGEAVSAHASTQKKAKVLVSMTVIIAIGLSAGWLIKGCRDDSDFRTQTVALSTSASTIASLSTENGQLRGQVDDLKTKLTNREDTIQKLKGPFNFTEDDNKLNGRGQAAYDLATSLKNKGRWKESVRPYEEAYICNFRLAINHPKQCLAAGNIAQKLMVAYDNVNLTNESAVAADAQIQLQTLFRDGLTLNPSSVALNRAFELYNKLNSKPAE